MSAEPAREGTRTFTMREVDEMTRAVVSDGLDAMLAEAVKRHLPDGTMLAIVILDAAEGETEWPAQVAHAGSLSGHAGDRYRALVRLAARQIRNVTDEPQERLDVMIECLEAAQLLASDFGLNMAVMGRAELEAAIQPVPRRERTSRTTRPSGRGGRSPKQRRKR